MGDYANDAIDRDIAAGFGSNSRTFGDDFGIGPYGADFVISSRPPKEGTGCKDRKCGGIYLTKKNRKTGVKFLGCSKWPKCKMTYSLKG